MAKTRPGPSTLLACFLVFVWLASASRAQTEAANPIAAPAIRPPLLVAVAIDGVGMPKADLRKGLDLVLAVFDRLPQGSAAAVLSFSGEQRILLPPTSDRARLSAVLTSYRSGPSGIALPDGLFDTVRYLADRDAEARAVLLISAGSVREGDLQFEDPLNAATAKGIPIVALGLGQSDGKHLRRVAKLTGGDYVRLEVADPAMLARSIIPSPARPLAVAVAPAVPVPVKVETVSPIPSPTPAPSGGFLGAAAIFLGGGGLLIFGVIVLLIRRMSTRPAATATVAASPGLARVVATGPKSPPPSAPAPRIMVDGEEMQIVEDDFSLEKTLVVNANPILRALSGPGAGKNFPLAGTGSTSLGRSRRNDIVTPEDAASAQHCRIDREGGSYVLYDLGATNGTWINGAKTDRAVLGHGDRLKVGETVFTVSLFGDRS